jgi:UDP-N-acetylmuramoyl-tripeptide--D-alanyl-D-alanine ligase
MFDMNLGSLKVIAEACAGELLSGSPLTSVRRVCTDSRMVQAGDLFFAISGPRFDGHDFLHAVVAKGAAAVAVCRSRISTTLDGCAIVAVDDTRVALGRLAASHRTGFEIPIVAVGGSNGKTTTKDLIAAVLRQRLTTLSSEARFENDVGVPLTLLKLEKTHQAAVLGVGTNRPGEVAPLVAMVRPQYGVITDIGCEHLQSFGDLTGVATEEAWLAELLPSEGKLFLSGDNEWLGSIARRTHATMVKVGFSDNNDWRVRSIRLDEQGTTFSVAGPLSDYAGEYRVNLLGRHQVANALFALALGAEFGLLRSEIEQGLVECRPAKRCLQLSELKGVRILDDGYNANADSMVAALETLRELPCKGRRVAVLGDMAELGPCSEAAHEEVGRRAAELGVGQLFAVGKWAPVMAQGARRAGLSRVFEFADVETAAAAVRSFIKRGDLLLLQASRTTGLQWVMERLSAGDGVRRN